MRKMVRTGVALGLMAGLAGCSSSSEGNNAGTTTHQSPPATESFNNPPLPAEFNFPGRVALTEASCQAWGPTPDTVRQQGRIVDGKLFAVIDARNSWPPNCDPETDSGAGIYSDAAYASPPVDPSRRSPRLTIVVP